MYKIINIQRAEHNKYGQVTMIKVNPLIKVGSCELFSPDESDDTKTFLVANDFADESLIHIARAKQPWNPNMSDFTEERTYDQNNKKHGCMYVDNSLLKSNIEMIFPIIQFYSEPEFDRGIELNEEWIFLRDCVKTPHGNLNFSAVAFVNDFEKGLQFLTNGVIRLNEISASLKTINITMLRLIKVCNDKNVSIQLFDSNNELIVAFSGGDSSFSKYVLEMKKYYKM